MKKVSIQLNSIIVSIFLYSFSSGAIIFECENGYSYKINKNTNNKTHMMELTIIVYVVYKS